MKTEQIVILVVAFFLGMLLLNMVKNVCGCELKEGFKTSVDPDDSDYGGEPYVNIVGNCNEMLGDTSTVTSKFNSERSCGGTRTRGKKGYEWTEEQLDPNAENIVSTLQSDKCNVVRELINDCAVHMECADANDTFQSSDLTCVTIAGGDVQTPDCGPVVSHNNYDVKCASDTYPAGTECPMFCPGKIDKVGDLTCQNEQSGLVWRAPDNLPSCPAPCTEGYPSMQGHTLSCADGSILNNDADCISTVCGEHDFDTDGTCCSPAATTCAVTPGDGDEITAFAFQPDQQHAYCSYNCPDSYQGDNANNDKCCSSTKMLETYGTHDSCEIAAATELDLPTWCGALQVDTNNEQYTGADICPCTCPSPAVSAVQTTCQMPGDQYDQFTNDCPSGTEVGEQCNLYCPDPADASSSVTVGTLVCGDGGDWSSTDVTSLPNECPKCSPIGVDDYGDYENDCPSVGGSVNESCSLHCQVGDDQYSAGHLQCLEKGGGFEWALFPGEGLDNPASTGYLCPQHCLYGIASGNSCDLSISTPAEGAFCETHECNASDYANAESRCCTSLDVVQQPITCTNEVTAFPYEPSQMHDLCKSRCPEPYSGDATYINKCCNSSWVLSLGQFDGVSECTNDAVNLDWCRSNHTVTGTGTMADTDVTGALMCPCTCGLLEDAAGAEYLVAEESTCPNEVSGIVYGITHTNAVSGWDNAFYTNCNQAGMYTNNQNELSCQSQPILTSLIEHNWHANECGDVGLSCATCAAIKQNGYCNSGPRTGFPWTAGKTYKDICPCTCSDNPENEPLCGLCDQSAWDNVDPALDTTLHADDVTR